MAENNNEQIRQHICVELEEVRMWTSFLVPLATLCLTIIFTKTLLDSWWAQWGAAQSTLWAIRYVLRARKQRINNAYQFIQQLQN